ncbi:hypothetical protein ACJX0J_005834, partial [Zea mays]
HKQFYHHIFKVRKCYSCYKKCVAAVSELLIIDGDIFFKTRTIGVQLIKYKCYKICGHMEMGDDLIFSIILVIRSIATRHLIAQLPRTLLNRVAVMKIKELH